MTANSCVKAKRSSLEFAIASAPYVALDQAIASARQLLPLSLIDLARELPLLARREPSFEPAAKLAKALKHELTLLTGSRPPLRGRRRTTCQGSNEQGISISSQQLSDLRLGERTRRIFQEAGLLYVQDVASLAAETAINIPPVLPTSVAEVRAAIMFSLEAAGAQRAPAPAPARPEWRSVREPGARGQPAAATRTRGGCPTHGRGRSRAQ